MLNHISKYLPDFALYEKPKRELIESHPNATPEQYQAAMREIAQRCGI